MRGTPARYGFVALLVVGIVGGSVWLLEPSGQRGGELTERWVSDTARNVGGNHHQPVAGRIDDRPFVFAPISGHGNSRDCALMGLDGNSGEVLWQHEIPPTSCTIHAVADPTLADLTGDGKRDVIAATTERAVTAFEAASGDSIVSHRLSRYGYTRPIVADLTGDGQPELLVVDVRGTVIVARPDGTTVWNRSLDGFVWARPALVRGEPEDRTGLLVALASGELYRLEADGSVGWHRQLPVDGSITWMTTDRFDRDGVPDSVVATARGEVLRVDGRDGSVRWRVDFGEFAAVRAVGDGDGDGDREVYAVAKDATLRALDASDGSVQWSTQLTDAEVQMSPPPVRGDVDGDGDVELVASTNDGRVVVLDPGSGSVLASYQRAGRVFAPPALADTDGDGSEEIYVMYGNGQVAALTFNATVS